MSAQTPIAGADRIHQLDVLRGVALLGILVMNMIFFGLPGALYLNPVALGPLEGLDRVAFLFSEVFANEKFMGLFSVLFGAGVVLFTDPTHYCAYFSTFLSFFKMFSHMIIGVLIVNMCFFSDSKSLAPAKPNKVQKCF